MIYINGNIIIERELFFLMNKYGLTSFNELTNSVSLF